MNTRDRKQELSRSYKNLREKSFKTDLNNELDIKNLRADTNNNKFSNSIGNFYLFLTSAHLKTENMFEQIV